MWPCFSSVFQGGDCLGLSGCRHVLPWPSARLDCEWDFGSLWCVGWLVPFFPVVPLIFIELQRQGCVGVAFFCCQRHRWVPVYCLVSCWGSWTAHSETVFWVGVPSLEGGNQSAGSLCCTHCPWPLGVCVCVCSWRRLG